MTAMSKFEVWVWRNTSAKPCHAMMLVIEEIQSWGYLRRPIQIPVWSYIAKKARKLLL
jgi:hypothetical protein